MMPNLYRILSLLSLLLSAGCNQAQDALGLSRLQPDEFRVVTRPSLNLPTYEKLEAPQLGKPSPFMPAPQDKAVATLGLGKSKNIGTLSALEKSFLNEARVFEKSPCIRQDLLKDAKRRALSQPDKWAQKILYWQKAVLEKGSPLDPYQEYKRLYGKSHPSAVPQ